MKLFIVGKYDTFVNELIQKFSKEGNKIYMLTTPDYHGPKPVRVFEQYCFPYDTDSITEILDSVRPDTVLFTGAYDNNFSWKDVRNETMHYIASLINLLISSQYVHVKRFIYLSSQDVFEAGSGQPLTEEDDVSPLSYKGLAIAQGESLCRHFYETEGLPVTILRLDHLYKIPDSRQDADDICSKMCLEALHTGKIQVNAKKTFSMIYVSDAVEGIYRLAAASEPQKLLYHLTSSEAVTSLELARLLCSCDSSLLLSDRTTGTSSSTILDGKCFAREFSFSILHPYTEAVPKIYRAMKRHAKRYSDRKRKNRRSLLSRYRSLITSLLPYAENLLLFIPAFMLNNRATGSVYFDKLDFYVLYVLLFAGIYGTRQAVLSALLSVAGFCFRQMYGRTGIELLIDYSTYLWIAQLFIIGMSVGHLRDSANIITRDKDEEIRYLNDQLSEIQSINESNNRIKNIYQERIINYDDSLAKIYDITSELDSREAGAVLFYAARVIAQVMDTGDVAIYQIANQDYCRLFSSTSEKARSLGKSLKYSDMTDMMAALEAHQVYINKSMNENYPQMASAIWQNDRPTEFIMLWGLPFEKMTLHHANLLTILGYMIYHSVERANQYLEALSTQRFLPGTKILYPEAFEELHQLYDKAAREGFIDYCVLETTSDKDYSLSEWNELLSGHLRLTDYLGMNRRNRICILLTNTTLSDARFIVDRLSHIDICCTVYSEQEEEASRENNG